MHRRGKMQLWTVIESFHGCVTVGFTVSHHQGGRGRHGMLLDLLTVDGSCVP